MQQYFFILYIAVFLCFAVFAVFLMTRLRKMYAHYRLFSNRTDVRALMAKDPRRFHISLIYLMAYVARSNSKAVKFEKFEFIFRYIREVCPQEIQDDAIEALRFVTTKWIYDGHRKKASIINVDKFKKGSDKCIVGGSDSLEYVYDLHGKRLAEELALYMTEDDRLYVMYMLYRLAAMDGKITTKGKASDVYALQRICVEGLKIEKAKLDELLDCYTEGTVQAWYDQHFSCTEHLYPSSDGIANLFRGEASKFASFEKQYSWALKDVNFALILSAFAFFFLAFFLGLERYAMGRTYPEWVSFDIFVLAFIVIPSADSLIVKIDSSLVPVVRTKFEDSIQLRSLVVGTVFSAIAVVLFFWGISNVMFLTANEVFCSEKPLVVSVPVTDTYTTESDSYYHLKFPEVSLADKQFDADCRPQVSTLNSICLKTLPLMSGVIFKGVENTKTMDNAEVDYSVYKSAVAKKKVKLHFKMGYYGLIHFDKCVK